MFAATISDSQHSDLSHASPSNRHLDGTDHFDNSQHTEASQVIGPSEAKGPKIEKVLYTFARSRHDKSPIFSVFHILKQVFSRFSPFFRSFPSWKKIPKGPKSEKNQDLEVFKRERKFQASPHQTPIFLVLGEF